MMETLDSNILVISKKGKVLGVSLCPGVEEITELIEDKVGSHVDPLLNDRFLSVLSTKENVNLQTLGFERDDIQNWTEMKESLWQVRLLTVWELHVQLL